jgi:UDP-glucose:glycoprotein glucosyltransferase
MTKEPKLDRAKRQIPEWSVYDNEVEALATRLAQAKENASKRTAGTGSSDGASNKRDEL